MISSSSPILLPPQACGRPSFFCSPHAISLLSDCILSRRALRCLWKKNQLNVSFSILGFLKSLTKSALAVWLSVGIGAGGLSSVPSGDDFPSQRLACYLSSIRLLCDKSQQYCHKRSRPCKVIPLESSPQKSPASCWAEWGKDASPCDVESCFLEGQLSGTIYFAF